MYQRAIGCLTYAATISRPDLSTAVSVLSNPGIEHWKGVKRVLLYVMFEEHWTLVLDISNIKYYMKSLT